MTSPASPRPLFSLFASRSALILLLFTTLVVALLYGYDIPYYPVLDDEPNLEILNRLPSGDIGAAWELIWTNHSGISPRAVPMFSFVIDKLRVAGDLDFVTLRLTNILLHLTIGWLIFGWLSALLSALLESRSQAFTLSAVVTTLWMIAPIQISTVYYPVQRMAMWPLFFIFAALWHYTWARVRLQDTRPRAAIIHLLVIYLFWFPLAWLSKETGALLPLFLVLLELGLLRSFASPIGVWLKRGHQLVIGGVVAGFAYVVLEGSRITYGGAGAFREFTVSDRIATQPFALWDYVRQILFPHIGRMGVYHDDFPIHSLSEWPAVLLLFFTVALFLFALLLLRSRSLRCRLIAFGVAFFFVGHLLESTIFNLELYFEHRNYLPSVGLFLAVAVMVQSAIERLPNPKRWLFFITFSYLALMLFYTAKEIHAWQFQPRQIEKTWEHHPGSHRAILLASEMFLALDKPHYALEVAISAPDQMDIPRSYEDRQRLFALVQLHYSLASEVTPDPALYPRLLPPWPGNARTERAGTLKSMLELPDHQLALLDWLAFARSSDAIVEQPGYLRSRSYAAYVLHAATLATRFGDFKRERRYLHAVHQNSPHYLPWVVVPLFRYAYQEGDLEAASSLLKQFEEDSRWSLLFPVHLENMRVAVEKLKERISTQESDDVP